MPVLHIHFFGWLVGFFFWSNKCASYHLYSNTILKAFDQVTPCSYSLSHPLFSNVTEQQRYAIRYHTATFTAASWLLWLLLLLLFPSTVLKRYRTATLCYSLQYSHVHRWLVGWLVVVVVRFLAFFAFFGSRAPF